jgi:hypothetical protein
MTFALDPLLLLSCLFVVAKWLKLLVESWCSLNRPTLKQLHGQVVADDAIGPKKLFSHFY